MEVTGDRHCGRLPPAKDRVRVERVALGGKLMHCENHILEEEGDAMPETLMH